MTNDAQTAADPAAGVLDALVVGLGSAGIYQLHLLREQGLNAHAIDAAGGVGGVWYWNRYPGARFDSESYSYGFFFNRDLIEEWSWSERFTGQPENERYFNWVTDKLDLRQHMSFNQRVAAAHYDDATATWKVESESGTEYRTRFLVLALGGLSAPQYPDLPGRETFGGFQAHTGMWPTEPVDFTGKKVAVIGTGPSGVQVVQTVAGDVAEMTVFQRSPHWVAPLHNAPLTAEDMAEIRKNIDDIHDTCMNKSFAGFVHCLLEESAYDHTPEQRRETYERLYNAPGFGKWLGNYIEALMDPEMNKEYSDFLAEKIRARVSDPELAEKLIPKDHGYGGKRPPFDDGYYEALSQDNVHLVDLRETPLVRVTENGLETTEKSFDFDIIVWATGFDALTGSYDRIDIRGKEGMTLIDWWADGPRTVLGLMSPNFPNLFSVGGPHSTGGNVPRATEIQVEFVAGVIDRTIAEGKAVAEPTVEAADAWTAHVMEPANGPTAVPELDYNYGGNIPGKKIVFRSYYAGIPTYKAKMAEIVDGGYAGIEFTDSPEAAASA